ncbi:hypothetical protein Vretifemale_3203 [Volvox reticuliferus]|nr:hypothetical protein Vretifemale_3203 [Volvox reticuliferus]
MTLLAVRAELQERLMAARLEAQAYIGGTGLGAAAGAGIGNRAPMHHQPGAAGQTSITHDVLAAGTGSANGTATRAWTEMDVPARTDVKATPAGVATAVMEGESAPTTMPIHSGSNDAVCEDGPHDKDPGRAAGGDGGVPSFRFVAQGQPGKRVGADDGGWRQESGDTVTDNGLRADRLGRSATELMRRPGRLRHPGQDKPRAERRPFSAGTSRVAQQWQAAAPKFISDGVLTVEQQQQQPGGAAGAGAAHPVMANERPAASDLVRTVVRSATSEEAFDDRDGEEPERCPREEEEEAAQAEAQRRMEKEKDQKSRWTWTLPQQQKPKSQKAYYQQAPVVQKQAAALATARPLSPPRQSPPPQQLRSQHQGPTRGQDVQAEEKKRIQPDRREEEDVIVETRKKRKGVDEATKQQQDEEENSQRKTKRSKGRHLKRDRSEQGRDKNQDLGLQAPSVPVDQSVSDSPSATPIASFVDNEVARAEAGGAANAATATGGCSDRPGAAAAAAVFVQGTSRAGVAGRLEPEGCATRVAVFARASNARGVEMGTAEGERDAVPSARGPPVQSSLSVLQEPSSASLKSPPGNTALGTAANLHHQSTLAVGISRAGSSDVEIVDLVSPPLLRTAPTDQHFNNAQRIQEVLPQQLFQQGRQPNQQQDGPQPGPVGSSRLHPQNAATHTVQPDFPRSQGWSNGPMPSGVEDSKTATTAAGNNGPQSEPSGQAVPHPPVHLNTVGAVKTDGPEVEQGVASVRTRMPPPPVCGAAQEAEVRTRKPPFRQESKGLREAQESSGRSLGSDATIACDAAPLPPRSLSDGTGSAKPPQQQQLHPQQHSAQPPRTHLVYPRNPTPRPSQRVSQADAAAANGTATTQLQEYGPVPPGPSHPHLQQQTGAQQGHAGKILLGGRGVPGPFRRQRMKAAGRRGGDEGGPELDLDGVLDEDFARTVDMLRQEQEHELQVEQATERSGPRSMMVSGGRSSGLR